MAKKKIKVIDFGLDPEGKKGVSAISIVDLPAIESEFIALSKDGHAEKHNRKFMFAQEGEQRMLYGAAMIPDVLILRQGKEGEDYYVRFSKQLIKDVAHDFMKNHLQSNVNLMHSVMVKGITIVETWTKDTEQDKAGGLGIDVPVGTWMVGMKVDSDEAWDFVRQGMFTGFSIEGDFISVKESYIETEVNDENMFLIELEQILTQ